MLIDSFSKRNQTMEREEHFLVSEIFRVFLSAENQTLVQKVTPGTSDFVFLLGTEARMRTGPQPFLFSKQTQAIEEVLLERLAVPRTPIFDYLLRCWGKASEEKSRHSGSGSGMLRIAEESLEIIRNYLVLALTTPEMFEEASFEIRTPLFAHCNTGGNQKLDRARQALYLIQAMGADDFTAELLAALSDQPDLLYSIALLFVTELRSLIIFNAETQSLLDLFIQLCSHKGFKGFVAQTFHSTAMANGIEVEQRPLLSAFLSKSILPLSGDPLLKEFEVRAVDRLKSCKTKNAYLKTCEVSLSESP